MIPITKTYFGPEELELIQKPLETGWVVQGPYVQQFEEQFNQYSGASHSIATTSCTTALHLAVASLDLKPGDEVIVPAFTWISTANVVEYCGATPKFCDIDLSTYNLDPEQIEQHVTPQTVGILPVHLFGLCADMDSICQVANRHNLWVVEDAACAFGSWYKGRHAGTIGDAGCFSFHPRKAITTGEGGMLTTHNARIADLSRCLRNHGASQTDLTRHTAKGGFLLPQYAHLGYNYRMTDVQGALGCAQMGKAEWILEQRKKWAQRYYEKLGDLDWLTLPKIPEDHVHSYQSFTCLFRPESPTVKNVERLNEQRNQMMSKMESTGIATRPGTHAPVLLDYYANKYNLKPQDYPNALLADQLSLSIPLFPQMTEAEHELVCSTLSEAQEQAKAA